MDHFTFREHRRASDEIFMILPRVVGRYRRYGINSLIIAQ
jgi:hypothetical protein